MSEYIEIHLTGIANGGSAVGRYEGRAVFVSYAIPGEVVRARIIADKGKFITAEAVEILEESSERVTPKCPHFGKCGGCHWQHITYDAQLKLKRQIVEEQMRRIGGFDNLTIYDTVPNSTPWNYRAHSTFHIAANRQLGFISIDNQTVIPLRECHIIRPELLDLMQHFPANDLSSERTRLQIGSEGQAIAFWMLSDDIPSPTKKSKFVFYEIYGRRFRCTAGSFFQVNLPQAGILIDKMLEYLDLKGSESILELYSGVGMFTAFLAERAKNVTSVEFSLLAVQDAVENLSEFENITIIEGKTEEVLNRLSRGRYDSVVLDPPRSGIDLKGLKGLVNLSPEKIVYISCDVATLARDSKKLREGGYQLLFVQPVDMFPQTYHIECIACFQKAKGDKNRD